MKGDLMRAALGVAVATVGLSLSSVAQASADVTTVYMTTQESCGLQCTVAMMQIDGSRVRVTINYPQSGGYGSIGWMKRRGDRVKGWVGIGDCSRQREVLKVEGHGSATHLEGMVVRSKAQTQAFVERHPSLGLFVPDGPIWTSMKQWRKSSTEFCG